MFDEVPNVFYHGGHDFELGSDMSMSHLDWTESPKSGNVQILKGGSTVFYVHGRVVNLGTTLEEPAEGPPVQVRLVVQKNKAPEK